MSHPGFLLLIYLTIGLGASGILTIFCLMGGIKIDEPSRILDFVTPCNFAIFFDNAS
jgi:hypothetical protein